MATIGTIKAEMHRASCAELLTLKSEADAMLAASPGELTWMLSAVYKEYNKKRFFECGGSNIITPHDGGFTPINYAVADGSAVLLENGDYALLESGDYILLEQ